MMPAAQLLVMSALAFGATPRGVVYEFTATWCGPCQQMSPMVSRLERQGYPIKKIDVDRHRDFAAKYRISSIPAFVLVIDGKEVDRVVGATSENRLRSMFARIPREEEKPDADVTLASHRTGAPRGNRVTPRPSKPRFRIPFLGKADDEPADLDGATVRGNIDDEEDVADFDAPARIATPMEASVRIRANNGKGINYGSGTIISSGDGRTIVLTCGHICRGMTKQGTMEIDIFRGNQRQTYLGKVVAFDEKADVGLLEFPTDEVYPYSPVALAGRGVKKGDAVASVGCGGGEAPTMQQHKVISLNRYLGPDHIECSGEPIEGRSGGGLFDKSGSVVGVCFARDPQDHRGLYCGLKPIHKLLDHCRLTHLYQQPAADTTTESNTPMLVEDTDAVDELLGEEADDEAVVYSDEVLEEAVAASDMEGDALDELVNSGTDIAELQEALSKVGEAEVVCVVRPIKNPRAASRVVILNRASDKFVRYLTNELESDPLYNTTTLKKPLHGQKPAPRATPRRSIRPTPVTAVRDNTDESAPRRYRRRR